MKAATTISLVLIIFISQALAQCPNLLKEGYTDSGNWTAPTLKSYCLEDRAYCRLLMNITGRHSNSTKKVTFGYRHTHWFGASSQTHWAGLPNHPVVYINVSKALPTFPDFDLETGTRAVPPEEFWFHYDLKVLDCHHNELERFYMWDYDANPTLQDVQKTEKFGLRTYKIKGENFDIRKKCTIDIMFRTFGNNGKPENIDVGVQDYWFSRTNVQVTDTKRFYKKGVQIGESYVSPRNPIIEVRVKNSRAVFYTITISDCYDFQP